MKTHKRILRWTLASLLVLPACDSVDSTDDDFTDNNGSKSYAQEPFSEELAVAGETLLRLDGVNGTIEISGQAGASSVHVSGTKRVGANTLQDAEQHLADLKVSVDRGDGEIYVKTEQPQFSNGRNYEVNYDITIPADLRVSVHSINGVVRLTNTAGGTVRLVNGNISSNGSLPDSGSLDLRTSNGNIGIQIPKSTSARLKASVVNGRITTSDLSVDGSTSGIIRSINVTLGEGSGQIDLNATNGTINVTGY